MLELLKLGLRITSSRDLDQARWLVKTVGVQAVKAATEDLASRRYPRPQKVIEHLGIERRESPRADLPMREAELSRERNRQRGWRAGADDVLN